MRSLMLLAVLTACAETEPDLDDLVTDALAAGRDPCADAELRRGRTCGVSPAMRIASSGQAGAT